MILILQAFALVFFLIASASVPTGRINMTALGLAFWLASLMFGGLR